MGEDPGRLRADCRGGEGARVDEECVPFVNNRDIDAVAVDVPDSATGAGVTGRNAGGFLLPAIEDDLETLSGVLLG